MSTQGILSAEDRYRTLLDAATAVADQPTVKAVLHSMRGILSSTCNFHGTELYVLGDDGDCLHVYEFDRDPSGPPIRRGAKLLRISAAARVLEEQKPVLIEDVSQEMLKHPEMAPFAPQAVGRSTYLFPVSASHKHYGILAVTKLPGQQFAPEDVEMIGSLASHVAVALECAIARDNAELYQRQVVKERDRLRLLLEINNHIVSQLQIDDLFRAASASIRRYFRNDFTGFWLIDKHSSQLECVVIDFPSSKGVLAHIEGAELKDVDHAKLRTRVPELWATQDMVKLPAAVRDKLTAELIESMAIAPLATASGPIGVLAMGSRQPNNFGQHDLDLLSQLSTQIALAVENAIAYGRVEQAKSRLEDERLYLESEILSEFNFEDMVGNSAAIQDVMQQVAIVAPTDSTVLIHGETGTGKELVARAIHNGSPRRDRTFIKLNCAAIPSGLLESELFGHEKGAFTGALMQKKGRFELADRGTLFLDEIGDISMELQPKLLRAVQEQEFERLGSTRTLQVSVRMIAATHRDIPAMIRNNQFREDLFYRLNVFPIEIPPLRERPGDIPLLVHYFVSRLSRRMQKNIRTIPKHAMEALVSAPWPGNVRELENFVERAVILTRRSELNVPVSELKNNIRMTRTGSVSTFQDAERQAIISALRAASGRLAGAGGAAERLGLKRTTLQNKMRRLQISRADYHHEPTSV